MSRLGDRLRAGAADLRTAFADAPVEAALGVGLALCLSLSLRTDGFGGDEFWRIAASVALAFPLVFGLSVLRVRGVVAPGVRWGATAAVLLLAAWFGLTWLHAERAADWWRWFLLTAAAGLLLLLAPAVPWRARDRRDVWAFAARLLARLVAIVLYAAALYALLAGAVAAVVSLFELGRPDDLYGDLAGAVFFAFAPLLLVGGIRRLAAPAGPGVPAPIGLLGRWLYAPALVVYLVILYAYGVKVLATGELPRNLLSPLVIAAGLIGLLGAFLLHPVHESDEHRGLSLLVRVVPAALLPLVPLAVWGLAARLGEYGWTEFRYVRLAVVAAIGALAVIGTARLLRRRPPLLTTIPALLAAVLLLAALGPWSAPAVSLRDQTARLRAAFAEAGVDPRRLPADTVTVDSTAFERIQSGARYLVGTHGVAALQEVVPAVPGSTREVWAMGAVLGLRQTCSPGRPEYATIDWTPGVPGLVGGRMWDVELTPRRTAAAGGVRVGLDGFRLVAEGDGWRAEGQLAAADPTSPEPGSCGERWALPSHLRGADARVDLRDAAGTLRAQLVVTRMSVNAEAPAEVRGLLLVP